MKPYGNQLNLKKKFLNESKKNSEKIFIINIKLIHQIFDTINISLLVLISPYFSCLLIVKENGQIHIKTYLKQELSIITLLIIFPKLRNFILVNLNLLIIIQKLNLKI